MKKERLVYFNGKLIPESEAKISIYDSALMFGDMVFEMTRSFNNKQFKLKEHIKRLFMGIKILKIPVKITEQELEKACYKTIEANKNNFSKDDEHRLMIDISRGLLGIYKNIKKIDSSPNIIIADFPLRWTVVGMGQLFEKGINAVITSQRVIPSQYMDPKIKNRSRLFYLMANIEVARVKGENNWALMLDDNGFVAEGSGDNFFIVKDNILISPKGKNILRGISRDYIMQTLCKQLKIKVIEKDIEPYDVYDADEAFMSGTPFCMLPVTSLNGIKIKNGKVGKIYQKLLNKWSKNVGIDIKKQIIEWNKKDSNKNLDSPTPYQFK